MARLIDSEKLLLEIRDDPSISGRAFARVKQHIDEAPAVDAAVQKWISVKDRLPEESGEYLCRHTDKSVHSAEYESIYGSFGYWFDFWEDEYKEWVAYEGVTHWMPLPQPPKGE